MKLNYLSFDLGKEYLIDEDVDLSHFKFSKNNRIDHISSCHTSIKAIRFDDCLKLSITLKGGVEGVCSYTLDKFPYPYSVKEELLFTKEEKDNDFILKGNTLELDELFVTLIDNSIPLSITKKDASLPKGGEGYRILTEEELEEERKHKPDPRWSKLDDLL